MNQCPSRRGFVEATGAETTDAETTGAETTDVVRTFLIK
jgi:hypothetical protein